MVDRRLMGVAIFLLPSEMSKKKQQKNGFFYYMLDMQQDFKQSGRDVPMRDMPIFAGPSWSKLSDAQKMRYNQRAKSEKAKASGGASAVGATCTDTTRAVYSPPAAAEYGKRDCVGNLLTVE